MKKAMTVLGALGATAAGAMAQTSEATTEITSALSDGKVQALAIIGAAGAVYLSVKVFGGVWKLAGAWIRAAIGGGK